ncbi:hypothetical protein PSACC_00926 [Paramicrosporidium saccamoebae]|uniref:Arp2/3 complex 34 kDa subunit n=1 Tax=Paramicrosporidium saccamoebae TaxID=1246581 RepID=A0A2H9TND4_9FUNG|nr:hypothetical protein PSACC_00926 [Paramicrosporidium saccamoebae]
MLSRSDGKRLLDQTFSDYGESRFHLWEDENDAGSILLSSSLPGFKNLVKLGLEKHLMERLSCGAKFTDAENGYDFTLRIPKDNITSNLGITQFILDDGVKQLSMLRRTCLALPLEMAIADQESGKTSNVMTIPLRSTDVMYIQGFPDRVTVVLATKFEDPSDIVLGKVFLQEFYDVRKQNNMQNAPAVLFGKEPPKEMTSSIPLDSSLNYITFVHYSEKKREKCVSMILSFRDYFHYHIKCCKAFLHNRMRGKVAEFLKMLNRTKPLSLLGSKSSQQ